MTKLSIISFFVFNLCLNNFIYPMEHSQNVSSSITPKSSEPLTFEQRQKIADELSGQANEKLEQSQEEAKLESAWCLDKEFSVKKIDKLKKVKDFLKKKPEDNSISYSRLHEFGSNLFVCENDSLSSRCLKIFDFNSGKYLYKINLLKYESDKLLRVYRTCRLPGNQIACLLGKEGNIIKIKIVDLNFCKISKDFIDCEESCRGVNIRQILYLSNGKLVLMGSRAILPKGSDYLMFFDLKSGKLLKTISVFDEHGENIFWPGSNIRISSIYEISEGKLLIEMDCIRSCIINSNTDEIEWKSQDLVLPKNYLSFYMNDITPISDNTIVGFHRDENKIIFLRNEKCNFEKIKNVLKDEKIILDLQNIVLEYLSDQWLFEKQIVIEKMLEPDIDEVHVLSKNKLLLLDRPHRICILNLNNGKIEEVKFKKQISNVKAMQDGRIAILFMEGSIEIWKEQHDLIFV